MQALPIKECMAWFYVNLHYDSWHEYMHAWFTLVHTCTHVQSSWSSVWFVSYLGDCRTHCFMDSSLRAQWSHHCVWSVYQQQWSVQLHQHISHTAHTERSPSQHCYYIQCQSIHHHRTRRVTARTSIYWKHPYVFFMKPWSMTMHAWLWSLQLFLN